MLPESKSAILHDINVAIERALIGRSCRSQILMSENPRELSVLLGNIQTLIDAKKQLSSRVSVQLNRSLPHLLKEPLKRLGDDLKIHLDLEGDFTHLLPEAFYEFGSILAQNKLSWSLIIDNLDMLNSAELGILLSAIHAANQKSLPVLCFATGSAQLTKKVGDAKPYAERLFEFRMVG